MPWQLAREWVGHQVYRQSHVNEITGHRRWVMNLCFAFRWLYPTPQLPGDAGFLIHRDSGWLPKLEGQPKTMVREGRILIRLVSPEGLPALSSTVIIRDIVNGDEGLMESFDLSADRIELTAERSICKLQMVLSNQLRRVWFVCWNQLLDEIDDSVSIQVSNNSSPSPIHSH